MPLSLLQPKNALSSIRLSVFGKVIFPSTRQPSKALFSTEITPSGTVTPSRIRQFLNVPSPMVFKDAESEIFSSEEQFSNAFFPRKDTLSGMTASARLLHPAKQNEPIETKDRGKLTFSSVSLPEKQCAPSEETLRRSIASGISTSEFAPVYSVISAVPLLSILYLKSPEK